MELGWPRAVPSTDPERDGVLCEGVFREAHAGKVNCPFAARAMPCQTDQAGATQFIVRLHHFGGGGCIRTGCAAPPPPPRLRPTALTAPAGTLRSFPSYSRSTRCSSKLLSPHLNSCMWTQHLSRIGLAADVLFHLCCSPGSSRAQLCRIPAKLVAAAPQKSHREAAA